MILENFVFNRIFISITRENFVLEKLISQNLESSRPRMEFDGIDPNDWENVSYSDLTHLNTYAKDKLIYSNQGLPFVSLASYWAECLSPGIPDGRYVPNIQFYPSKKLLDINALAIGTVTVSLPRTNQPVVVPV